MRAWALGIGLLGVSWAAFCGVQAPRSTTFVITGDIEGYLEPCGCTTPQTGGILRQASLIHGLSKSSDVVLMVNGALTITHTRQDQMKVEMLAESFGALNVTAINLSVDDAALGIGSLLEIQNLTNRKLISGSVESSELLPIEPFVEGGPLLIGGACGHPETLAAKVGLKPVPLAESMNALLEAAQDRSLKPALLLDGDETEARTLAAAYPKLVLVVYRSPNDSPTNPARVGDTLLVTPGEFGKSLVEMSSDGKGLSGYQIAPLTPSFQDDAEIKHFYKSYLGRVDKAGFLDHVAVDPTAPFAGSSRCATCHAEAFNIWSHSKHPHGLASLEAVEHAHDPDCVRCHVVGLGSTTGFRSRALTPDLSNVGCESCHGPAKLHAQSPRKFALKKVGNAVCIGCHSSEQDPGFNFAKYWAAIKHR